MKNLNKNDIPWYGVVWKTLLVTAVLFAFSFTAVNAQCEWTVEVTTTSFGDEISWELTDALGNTVLESTNTGTFTAEAEGPLDFYISTQGMFNDNDADYTISNGIEEVASGHIDGGQESTETGLECTVLNDCANANAGMLTTQDMSVCAGVAFTLDVEGNSDPADGLTGQWMSSVDGGTDWSVIDGATSASYTVSDGVTEETQFKYVVSCDLDDSSDETGVVTISLNAADECYCEPEGTNSGRYVNNFNAIGDGVQYINNQDSGFSDGGYGDYTNMVVSVNADSEVNFDVDIEGGTAGFRIWVDWNNDGSFDPEEEVAYQSDGYSANHEGSFEVPGDADGDYRMRIVSHWLSTSGDVDPCETGFSYGEFEDYTVSVAPVDCLKPTDLAVDNITDSSAEVSWTTTANQSDIYLVGAGEPAPDENSTPTESGVTSPVTLDNLDDSSAYEVYVRADCGAEDGVSTWAGPVSLTTTQIPASLPYIDDFTTNQFSFVNGTQTNKWEYGSAAGNPSNAIYISNDGGTSNTYSTGSSSVVQAYRDIIVPADATTAEFSFDWRAKGEGFGTFNYDYFRVWLVSTSYIPTPGTQITSANGTQIGGNFNNQDDWQSFSDNELDVSAFAGQTMRLVFEWRNDFSGGTQPPAAIDNIHLEIPDCPSPISLAVDNITDSSAEVSWTTDANLSDVYYIQSGAGDPDEYSAPTHSGVTSPLTLEDLYSNENYDVYVRADCGEEDGVSSWVGPVSFTTDVAPPENDSPEDAIALECDGSYEGNTLGATDSDMGATELCATGSSGYAKDVWFTFEADGMTDYTLTGGGFDGVIEVYDEEMEAVACVDDFGQSDELTVETPEEGTYYVRYFAYFTSSAGSYTMSMDCVSYEECETAVAGTASTSEDMVCPETPFTVSVEGSSIDDEANENVAGFSGQWEASVDGVNWTAIEGETDTELMVDGIEEETSYRYVVTCSAGDEDTSNEVTLSINDDVMACMCTPNAGTSTVEEITLVDVADLYDDGVNTEDGYVDNSAMTAQVNVGESYEIALEGNTNGGWTNYFTVWIDWNQNGVFSEDEMYEIGSINSSTGDDGQQATGTIDVPADALIGEATMRVIKNFSTSPTDPCGSYNYGQAKDYTVNVSGEEPEICETPTDLTFGDITFDNDGAHLPVSWTPVGSETQWEVYYENPGDSADNGTEIVNDDPNTILDLTAGQGYDVQVRAVCGDDFYSDWSEADNIFITPPVEPCEAPELVEVTNITEDSADISWSGGSQQGYWIIAYGEAPYTPAEGDGVNGFYGENLTETLTDLEPGTDYNVYVRAMCEESFDNLSDWTSTSFTTELPPCDYPELNTTIVDENENPIDCVDENGEYWILVELLGDTEHSFDFTSYHLEGNVAENQTSGDSFVAGPYLAGQAVTFFGIPVDCQGGFEEPVAAPDICETTEDCSEPTGISFGQIDFTSAEVSWTPGDASQDEWEVVYGPAPFNPLTDTGESVTVNNNPTVTLTGLTPGTTYQIYVRAICDDGDTTGDYYPDPENPGDEGGFDTPEDCAEPTAISFGQIDFTSAQVSWTPGDASQDKWEVVYGPAPFNPLTDTGESVTVDDNPEVTLTGLTPGTTYQIYVRAICDDGDTTGDYYPDPENPGDEGGFDTPEDCEDPYNDDAATSDVYISSIDISGIGADLGDPTYDLNYTSNSMSTDGYDIITDPVLTVYPGLDGTYTVSSGPAGNTNQYYYSVWVDFNQNGCFEENEQIIWSDNEIWGGGIPNGEPGVEDVPIAWELTGVAPGTYQARIRNSMIGYPLSDGNGDGEALDFTVVVLSQSQADDVLGVDSQVFTDFTYYPNPVEGQLNLRAGKLIEQVEVYNLLGQKVIQEQPNALESNLTTDRLQSGVYLMNVTIDGSQKTFRIVKK